MATSVGVNKLSIVNADTNGTTIAFPDVCKTPTPGGPVPIPYPNIARSADTANGTKTVKVDGKPVCVKDSNFKTSTGDEHGTAGGGVGSSKTKGKAEFVNCSFDVSFEGQGAARSFDLMLHNDKNTPPFPVLQGPVVATGCSRIVTVLLRSETPLIDAALATAGAPVTEKPPAVRLDGKRVEVEGRDGVLFRCGKASIALEEDGQLVLRGVNIVIQATEVNKIRGGKIDVN